MAEDGITKGDPAAVGKAINDMLNGTSPPQDAIPTNTSDDLFMGLTLAGLMLSGFFSLVGMAFVIYAKKQGRLIIGLCGGGLMLYPYCITNTWLILLVGLFLTFLPSILKRFNVDM